MFDDLALVRAIHRFERDNAATKIEALARAWQEYEPVNATAHAALALASLMTGDAQAAYRRVERVMKPGTACALGWYVKAILHRSAGEVTDAIVCLQQALIVQPHDGDALRALTGLFVAVDRIPEALELLERLDACGQAMAEDLTLAAELILHAGPDSLAQVRTLLARARGLDVTCAACWAVDSELHARTGQPEKAKLLLEHASVISPENPVFLLRRAMLAVQMRDPERGVDLSRRVLALQPANNVAMLTFVDACMALNRLDEALRVLERFPAGEAGHEVFLRRVQLLAHANRFDEATAALAAAPDGLNPVRVSMFRAYVALMQNQPGLAFSSWLAGVEQTRVSPVQTHGAQSLTFAVGNLLEALPLVRFARQLASRGTSVNLVAPDDDVNFLKSVEGVTQVFAHSAFAGEALPLQCLPSLAGHTDSAPLYTAPVLKAAVRPRRVGRPGNSPHPVVLLNLGAVSDDRLLDALGERFAAWRWHVIALRPIERWKDTLLDIAVDVIDVADTADLYALAAGVDHAVSLDGLVAHLRGSAGLESDVLLPVVHDPVWAAGHHSPWYPAARLHRCSPDGSWDRAMETFDRAHGALEAQ